MPVKTGIQGCCKEKELDTGACPRPDRGSAGMTKEEMTKQ
jgi:hypothetical protein